MSASHRGWHLRRQTGWLGQPVFQIKMGLQHESTPLAQIFKKNRSIERAKKLDDKARSHGN
jgi:hypothetical protein